MCTGTFPSDVLEFTANLKQSVTIFYSIQFIEAPNTCRGFDSRWCHLIFFIDIILPAALWPCG